MDTIEQFYRRLQEVDKFNRFSSMRHPQEDIIYYVRAIFQLGMGYIDLAPLDSGAFDGMSMRHDGAWTAAATNI